MDSAIGRLRPGRPSPAAIVLAAAIALALGAWAVSSSAPAGGSSSVSSPNVLPVLFRYAPTTADVRRSFADHGVRLYRADATVLQPRFAPIRRYTVAMWRPAGTAHMLIALLAPAPDRAVDRFMEEFAPPGVVGSESSGRVWVEYGRMRPAFAARVRAAFRELRALAPPA